MATRYRDVSRLVIRYIATACRQGFSAGLAFRRPILVWRHGWQLGSSTARSGCSLDGDVAQLDVWLAHGKLRVVGTDGPPRIEVKRVGRRGLTVTHEDGVLSVRHEIAQELVAVDRPVLVVHWPGGSSYAADVSIAVPPTATGSLTVVSGSAVASACATARRSTSPAAASR